MRYREVEKILKADGWYEVDKKGSHHHFEHSVKPGKVTVPEHGGSDVDKDIVRLIFRQAGIK